MADGAHMNLLSFFRFGWFFSEIFADAGEVGIVQTTMNFKTRLRATVHLPAFLAKISH